MGFDKMLRYDGGFRKAGPDYFDWVLSVPQTRRQISPFILVCNGDTHAVDNVDRLLTYGKYEEVLQAWPGKYRTDIFQFQVKDLIEYIQGRQ